MRSGGYGFKPVDGLRGDIMLGRILLRVDSYGLLCEARCFSRGEIYER